MHHQLASLFDHIAEWQLTEDDVCAIALLWHKHVEVAQLALQQVATKNSNLTFRGAQHRAKPPSGHHTLNFCLLNWTTSSCGVPKT